MDSILITGGTILDGTGAAPVRGDLWIENGRIADVIFGAGEGAGFKPAPTESITIDATGQYVAPGFIDTHIHTDIQLLIDPQQEASLRQGVTTHIIGQDG